MAQIGHGTKVAISTALTGTSFTDVAEVIDATPPNSSADTVDVTHMSSAGGVREFIVGLTDPGEVTVEMAFVPGSATDVLVRQIRDSKALCRVRFTFVNGATIITNALVTGYEVSIPIDDRMTASVTLKASGVAIHTPAV